MNGFLIKTHALLALHTPRQVKTWLNWFEFRCTSTRGLYYMLLLTPRVRSISPSLSEDLF